jgi:hypothetical protein
MPSALGMRGGVAGALAALLQGRELTTSGSNGTTTPPDEDSGEPSKRVLRVRSLFVSDIHLVRRRALSTESTAFEATPTSCGPGG